MPSFVLSASARFFGRAQPSDPNAGPWDRTGTVVHLDVTSDTVAIGATVMSGTEKLRVVGNPGDNNVARFERDATAAAAATQTAFSSLMDVASVGAGITYTAHGLRMINAGANAGFAFGLVVTAETRGATSPLSPLTGIRADVGAVDAAGTTLGAHIVQPSLIGGAPSFGTSLLRLEKEGGTLVNFIEAIDVVTTRLVLTDTGELIVGAAAPVGGEKLRVVGGARVEGQLTELVTGTFSAEFDNGSSGAAATIDWNSGQKQRITLTAAPVTLSFTNPPGPANILIRLVQDGAGSRTVTWPASVKWPGGTAPTLTTTGGAIDIISFYFDGTDFYGVDSLDFS